MKSIRGFALGLVAGIALAISTVGIAQTAKPADKSQKAESCCTMSCCCQGDSCAMHTAQQHAQMKDDNAQMKAHANEGGCCCCGGDSCDMQMKANGQAKQKQE